MSMSGARRSLGLVADISQRIIQNTSFRCQQIRGLRVGNSDIPNDKRLEVALQHIYGIGRKRAHQILADLCITNKLTKELTGLELNLLREEVNKYIIGDDLKRLVHSDIQRKINSGSYIGYRHVDMLPCRGQRTRTNARTRKDQGNRNKTR